MRQQIFAATLPVFLRLSVPTTRTAAIPSNARMGCLASPVENLAHARIMAAIYSHYIRINIRTEKKLWQE